MSTNRTIAEATLKDLLDQVQKQTALDMNCHAVGVVESFNPAKQTCSVEINYLKTILERDLAGNYFEKTIQYPVLIDCPIIVMSGGLAGITFPIKKGDSCLVLFNDRDMDNWFAGANMKEVATSRLHSMADGIVLVGVRSLAKIIQGYDPENVDIFNGTTRIKIKAEKILIENATYKLGVVLKELITEIKAITTTNCVVGAPVAVSPASQALLDQISVKIEGLLE